MLELSKERCLQEDNFTNRQFNSMSSFVAQLSVLTVRPWKILDLMSTDGPNLPMHTLWCVGQWALSLSLILSQSLSWRLEDQPEIPTLPRVAETLGRLPRVSGPQFLL